MLSFKITSTYIYIHLRNIYSYIYIRITFINGNHTAVIILIPMLEPQNNFPEVHGSMNATGHVQSK